MGKLAKNIAWNQFGNASTIFLGFLFQLFILRYFDVGEVAAYFMTLSLAYFALLPTNFSFNVMVRYIPFNIGKKKYGKVVEILILGVLYTLLLTGLIGIILFIIKDIIEGQIESIKGKVETAVLFMIFLNLNGLVRVINTAFNQFKEVAIMNSITAMMKFFLIIAMFFLYAAKDYNSIMFAFIIALTTSTVYGAIGIIKPIRKIGIKINIGMNIDEIISMAKYSISTFIENMRVAVLSWIDLLFLGNYSGSYEISGYGGTASFSRTITNFIVGSFSNPLLTKMSEEEGKKKGSIELFKAVLPYMALVSAFAGGLMFSLSKEIIMILIPKYSGYYYVLQIFSLMFVFFSVSSLCKILLMSKRWLRPLLFASLMIISSDIILNYFLVQRFGAVGAATGTLLAFIFEFIFFLIFFIKNFSINLFKLSWKYLVIFALISSSVVFETNELYYSLIMKFIISIIFGVLALMLVNKKLFYEIVSRIKSEIKAKVF